MVFKIGFFIMFLAVWFGLLGPWMVSMQSDALVLCWCFLTIIGAMFLIHSLYKRITKDDDKE